MNIRYLKMLTIFLVMFFLSSCAVFIKDKDHHHRRWHWHYHSSAQQSEVQMTAQNSGDSIGHEKGIR